MTSASNARNQISQQNVPDSDYFVKRYVDRQNGEFKPPMSRSIPNGSRRLPALLTASKNTFSRNFNQPQQTITPHFSNYGELSELSNFRNIPELYSIKSTRLNSNFTPSGRMVNGQEPSSLLSSIRCENQTPALSNSNYPSTPSFYGSSASSFNKSCAKSMGLKSNCLLVNVRNTFETGF